MTFPALPQGQQDISGAARGFVIGATFALRAQRRHPVTVAAVASQQEFIVAHAVFALSPAHHDCVQALLSAGFRPDEISVVPAAPTLHLSEQAAVPAQGQGTLSMVLHGVASLAQTLTTIGVPLWAAHRFETALIGGVALIAVHTSNAYEVDTIATVLRDGGCEHVVACVTVPPATSDVPTPSAATATASLRSLKRAA